MRGGLTVWASVVRGTVQAPSLSLLKYRGYRASKFSRSQLGRLTVLCGLQYLWIGELEGGLTSTTYMTVHVHVHVHYTCMYYMYICVYTV